MKDILFQIFRIIYPNPASRPTLYIKNETIYAVTKVIEHIINGHFQLLVSCLIAPIVAKHGIYNRQNTIKENADNGENMP